MLNKKTKLLVGNAKKSFINKKQFKPLVTGNSKSFYGYLQTYRSNDSNTFPYLKDGDSVLKTPE